MKNGFKTGELGTNGFGTNCVRLGKSLAVSFITSVLLLVLASTVLYAFRLNRSQGFMFVLGIYLLSNFAGAFVLSKMIRQKRLISGIAHGIAYASVLFAVSFVANNGIHTDAVEFIQALAVCVAGGAIGGVLG